VRQWVLSLPKRLRYFLKSNPAAVTAVLQILLRVIQQELVKRCPDAPDNARLGAVSFIHRFGDALNEHIHFHCCVIDAVFSLDDGALRISELPALTRADIAAIQTRVSHRVLRWFVRRGWLEADEARAMRDWHNDGGFSLDAAVRIPGWDRAGLERLLHIGEINVPLHRPVSHPCSPFTRLRSATGRTVFAHPSMTRIYAITCRSRNPMG